MMFTIYGAPVPYKLAVSKARGPDGFAQLYERPRSKKWKHHARRLLAAEMAGRKPLDGPLALLVTAVFPCPKGDRRKTLAVPRRWHVQVPDGSNVLKAVEDAGNEIVWLDDKQIVDTRCIKVVGNQHERARVIINVMPREPNVLPLWQREPDSMRTHE